MERKFFVCKQCGNLVEVIDDSGMPMVCCGEKMTELKPCSTDGAFEKHVPVYTVDGNKVCVKIGEAEHPMLEAHYIKWISLTTNKGTQMKKLTWTDKPEACFMLCDGETVESVYEYCNLHGLWKK